MPEPSAGCIYLLVMMPFHQFDIESGRCQHLGGILKKLQEQIDPQGHIGRLQYRYLLCRFFYLRKLFL